MNAPQPWPPSRLCPATSNLPTRMLPGTWHTLCASYQRREAVGANRQNGMTPEDFAAISAARFPCAVCAGQALPPGMELITQEEYGEMARATKRGTCELCGASANVGMNHGAEVCPQCTHVQSALNKRIESVAAAARSMGKTEELLGHLIPAGGGIAVKVTADLLQEISGIVGYEGEDPGELVAAVRRRALTCASCDSEDILAEIREIVGYSPNMGDSGLADAVRDAITSPVPQCTYCIGKRDDLLRACGLPATGDSVDDGEGWDVAATAAIQEIARLEYRRDFWASKATKIKIEAGDLRSELLVKRGEIAELSAKLQEALAANDSLSGEIYREKDAIAKLRTELTLAAQSRDEWEQLAVEAKANVETLEAELRNREGAPSVPSCKETYLLDLALTALREEPVTATQLAALIDAARRAA